MEQTSLHAPIQIFAQKQLLILLIYHNMELVLKVYLLPSLHQDMYKYICISFFILFNQICLCCIIPNLLGSTPTYRCRFTVTIHSAGCILLHHRSNSKTMSLFNQKFLSPMPVQQLDFHRYNDNTIVNFLNSNFSK